jgi:hypothetical protein
MPAFLAPMLASAVLSTGQGYLANRQRKQEEERQKQQAAQSRLIQSFNPGAQPAPMPGAQGPGVGQQMLGDPLTQKLLAGLIGKGLGGLGTPPPVTPPPVTPRAYMPGVYP